MIILGIDPGLGKTGWGVIEYVKRNNAVRYIASGVIYSDTALELGARLYQLSYNLEQVILAHTPSYVGLEEVFVNNNPLSSMKLCHARGALMAVISKHNLKQFEFAPNTVKKTIVGFGKATKEQVEHMVALIIPSSGKMKTKDESDALAIAYTCAVHM